MNLLLNHLIEPNPEFDCIIPQVEHTSAPLRRAQTPREEINAKAKTAAALLTAGMQATMTAQEEQTALRQFHREVNQLPIQTATIDQPGTVLKLAALLNEYDHEVVKDAAQMRQYVTNRLLEESDPKAPPSTRLAALKLLGIEVGMFTERSEVTVKTLPTPVIEAQLRERLLTLIPAIPAPQEIQDVTPIANP